MDKKNGKLKKEVGGLKKGNPININCINYFFFKKYIKYIYFIDLIWIFFKQRKTKGIINISIG